MNDIRTTGALTEIFDAADRRSRLLLGSVVIVVWLAVLSVGIAHSGSLWRSGWGQLLFWIWVLWIVGVLSIPSIIRHRISAFRHEPLARIDGRGIWCRDWSSLGTVEWADIETLALGDGRAHDVKPSDHRDLYVTLRDREKYLQRLVWSERLDCVP